MAPGRTSLITALPSCATCLQDKQRQLEAIEARRDALQQRKADLEAKIRDLGPLPTEAFEAHLDRPLPELHKLLGKANQELKKFRWGSSCELAREGCSLSRSWRLENQCMIWDGSLDGCRFIDHLTSASDSGSRKVTGIQSRVCAVRHRSARYLACDMSRWCSRLSHQSNTLKVTSSILV